jgi:hypothetical protein
MYIYICTGLKNTSGSEHIGEVNESFYGKLLCGKVRLIYACRIAQILDEWMPLMLKLTDLMNTPPPPALPMSPLKGRSPVRTPGRAHLKAPKDNTAPKNEIKNTTIVNTSKSIVQMQCSKVLGVTFALCINVIGECLVGSQYTVNGIHFSDRKRYDIHIYTYVYT